MTIEWKDPPPARQLKWAKELAPLKDHPGKWALIIESTYSSRAAGILSSLRKGGENPDLYELAYRPSTEKEGFYDLYARFLGKKT